MSRPNDQLLDQIFPGIARRRPLAPNETLLSIDRAQRVLGFKPKFSWRDQTH
jgi:hypothetical protein